MNTFNIKITILFVLLWICVPRVMAQKNYCGPEPCWNNETIQRNYAYLIDHPSFDIRSPKFKFNISPQVGEISVFSPFWPDELSSSRGGNIGHLSDQFRIALSQAGDPQYNLTSSGINNILSNSDLSSIPDNQANDGWELVTFRFGNQSTGSYEDRPYFVMYNRHTAKMRVFIYTYYNAGSPSPGLTFTMKQLGRKTKIFESSQVYMSQLSDRWNGDNEYTAFNKLESSNGPVNKWLFAEFELDYDPCTCYYSAGSDIKISVNYVEKAYINIKGKVSGTSVSKVDINGTTGKYDADNLFSFNNIKNAYNDGKKAVSGGKKLVKDFESFKTETDKLINKRMDVIEDNMGKSKTMLDDLVQEAYYGTGTNAITDVVGLVGEIAPYAGAAYGVYNLVTAFGNIKKPVPPPPPTVTHHNLDVVLSGTIETDQIELKEFDFPTPGTSTDPELIYNNPVGVFTALNGSVNTYLVDGTLDNSSNSFPCMFENVDHRRSYKEFVFDDIKLAFNPLSELDLDNMKVMASMNFEVKEHEFPNNSNSNSVESITEFYKYYLPNEILYDPPYDYRTDLTLLPNRYLGWAGPVGPVLTGNSLQRNGNYYEVDRAFEQGFSPKGFSDDELYDLMNKSGIELLDYEINPINPGSEKLNTIRFGTPYMPLESLHNYPIRIFYMDGYTTIDAFIDIIVIAPRLGQTQGLPLVVKKRYKLEQKAKLPPNIPFKINITCAPDHEIVGIKNIPVLPQGEYQYPASLQNLPTNELNLVDLAPTGEAVYFATDKITLSGSLDLSGLSPGQRLRLFALNEVIINPEIEFDERLEIVTGMGAYSALGTPRPLTDFIATDNDICAVCQNQAYIESSGQARLAQLDSMKKSDAYAKIDRIVPNPVSGPGYVEYSVEKEQNVAIRVVDITGRETAVLQQNQVRAEGVYQVPLDASSWPSGVYICLIQTDSGVTTEKIVVQ